MVIPTLAKVCAAFNPLTSGQTNIQNAIGARSVRQVVQLGVGVFTIAGRPDVAEAKWRPAIVPESRFQLLADDYRRGPRLTGRCGRDKRPDDPAAGSNSLQAARTAWFSVGQIILLDEASGEQPAAACS
jgi:hypothetical protein